MTCRLVTPGGHPGDNILHRAVEELEVRFAASLEPAICARSTALAAIRRPRAEAKARPGNDNHGHGHGTHGGHDHAPDHAGHSHAASAGSHGHDYGLSTGGACYRSRKVQLTIASGIGFVLALAAADVGIAMGGETDVALETADAVIRD